jgi:hypothetical protein
MDARLAQMVNRIDDIIEVRPRFAGTATYNSAYFIVIHPTGILLVLAIDKIDKCHDPLSGGKPNGTPLLNIDAGYQFAFSQIIDYRIAIFSVRLQRKTMATAASVKSEDEPRQFFCPAMHPGMNAKCSVDTVHCSLMPLDGFEPRIPHQRAIAKHPKIAHTERLFSVSLLSATYHAASSSTKSTSREYQRMVRFASLMIVIVLIGFGWHGVWHWGAGQVESRIDQAISQLQRRGIQIDCDNRQITGYPFRIGMSCDSVSGEIVADGTRTHAGAFRTAAQFYDPGRMVAELDGPARIEPSGSVPLIAEWTLMHASIRAGIANLSDVSIEGRDLVLTDGWAPAGTTAMAKAGNAQIHARRSTANGESLDVAVKGSSVFPAGETRPSLDLGAEITIDDIVPALQTELDLERLIRTNGLSGRIMRIFLAPASGGRVELQGPFSIDTKGRLSAELTLGFSNIAKVGEFLAVYMPQATDSIGAITAVLGAIAQQRQEGTQLSSIMLTIENGTVQVGMIPVGNIPPLL